MSHYHLVPYNELPTTPDSSMQFASWSTTDTDVVWSSTKPSTAPDGVATFAVGITTVCPTYSTHATQLAAVPELKDPGTPPHMSAHDISSFMTAFNQWIESEDLKGFHIPDDAPIDERP